MEMSALNEFPIELDRLVKVILEKENFGTYKIDKRQVLADGANYLGTLYEIDVFGQTKDAENKELHLFVKHIIDGTELKQVSVPDMYAIELFAYKELFKIYADLQEKANVPLTERYQVLRVYEESNAEILIMENLTQRGFVPYHRKRGATLSFFETAVKQLAKFHALSFVLKEKRPEYFNEKIKSLKYPYFFNDTWKKAVKGVRDITIKYIDEDFKEKFKQLYENSRYEEHCSDDSIKVCLCHADYKPLNIMVKLDEDEIQEAIIIDYQMIHYGCPVFDFLYLIFVSSDREFRKAHLTNLKELYYETLSTFLRYFDLDVHVVYPREDFEKVYNEKLDFGLMTGLIFAPLVLAAEKDLPDFTQEQLNFSCDDIIRDRLRGMIEDYTEWGFI